MRVLTIHFKNLNSLAGEWEIDLTATPYRVDGIFAITGPTGAGKSTLLDALCLALYGRTPRLKAITDSSNEIMSKQQSECFSEVTYEVEKNGCKHRYRSYWGQHRARKAPDGALQPPRREIAEADTGKVLETKISEVAKLAEHQTGMDFDRFTRSMLLAQGEFTTFLKATPAERAPILEQITGTEIYSEISVAVHERRVLERQKLETLRAACEGIRALSPEEEKEVSDQLASGKRESAALKATIVAIVGKIAWWDGIRTLELQQRESEEQLRSILSEADAFESDRLRLERANRALPLQGGLEVLKTLRAQQEEDSNQSERYRRSCSELEVKVREAEQETRERQDSLNQAKEEKERGLRLIAGIKGLDLRIIEADRRIDTFAKEVQRLLGISRQLADTRKQKAEEWQSCQEEGERLDQWLSANRNEERLGETLIAIRQSVAGFKSLAEKIRLLREMLVQTQDRRAAAKKRHQELYEKLQDLIRQLDQAKKSESNQEALIQTKLAGRTLEEMRNQLDRLKSRKNWLERLIDPLGRIIAVTERLAEIDSLIAERDREYVDNQKALRRFIDVKEKAEQNAEALKRLIERMRRVRDLESERKKLEDNVPCPLCGALEHPYADGNIPVLDLEEAELENVMREIRELSGKIEALNREIATIEANKAHLIAENAEKKKALEADTGVCGALYQHLDIERKTDPRENLTVIGAVLKEAAPIIDRLASEIRELESEEKRSEARRKIVESLSEGIRKAEKDLSAAAQEESLSKQTSDQTTEALAEREGDYGETSLKLIESLTPYGFSDISPESADSVLETLDTRRQRWTERKQRRETLTSNQSRIAAEISNLKETINTRESEIAEKQTVLKENAEERETILSSRREQFQEKDTGQEEKRLTDALESAEKAMEKSKDRLNQRLSDRQSTRELMEKLDRTLRERATEIGNRVSKLQTQLTFAGFLDETDFICACMEEPQRIKLSRRDTEIREKKIHHQETLRKLENALRSEREKRLSEEPYEKLRSESVRLEDQHHSLQERLGALQQTLKAHDQAKKERTEQLAAIEVQTRESERWDALHALIGSADGKKYRNFAQGLTFVTMVAHANEQLAKLTDRYLLSCDSNTPLELTVQDMYQAGVSRSTKNLSGGESFLVSLALALGLSQMSSRNVRVDSLFLDEGFGTLDEEALETALETLSGLRQEGKLIGVISHVSGIKERIPVQIEVIPLGGGISAIRGPGCRRLSKIVSFF